MEVCKFKLLLVLDPQAGVQGLELLSGEENLQCGENYIKVEPERPGRCVHACSETERMVVDREATIFFGAPFVQGRRFAGARLITPAARRL